MRSGHTVIGWPRIAVALAALATSTVFILPTVGAHAATRSRGQFFVFDSPDCTGNGNAPRVTVPASVGGRNYPPLISMQLFATDMATRERFGPFVATTDANGSFCERVERARSARWKIDLIEPGSGSTDSKVVTVLAPPPASTTTVAPTTTAAATTTVPVTTTTVGGTTTTDSGTTTTASTATTSTVAATTTTLVDSEVVPPIELVPVPVPPSWALPGTGSTSSTPLSLGAMLVVLGGLLMLAVRRRAQPPVIDA